MNDMLKAVAIAFIAGAVLGIVGCFIVGTISRSGDTEDIERLRAVAERIDRELTESKKLVAELGARNQELTVTNTELAERNERAAEHNRELAERNQRITDSLDRAEQSLARAVGDSNELAELIDSIIRIVEDLFSGNGIGDPGP